MTAAFNGGLPYRLTAVDPESERANYVIVRRDFVNPCVVEGLILSASQETGQCLLRLPDGTAQEFNFGPEGLRIMRR